MGGRATARPLILFLISAALVVPAASASNENGWGGGSGAIMCNQTHSGYVVNVGGGNYRCVWRYDTPYHAGIYEPGWGWVGACPSFSPYMGYCWSWTQT